MNIQLYQLFIQAGQMLLVCVDVRVSAGG